MGFSADTPMEAAWRDARITRIYEGTNEINRMLCVGMLIKKAMKGHVDLLNPAMAVADELTGIPSFETPDFSEALAQEKALIASMKKVFLMVAGHAVQTFGPELEEHQQLLLAAADIMIAVYMSESALLRAQKTLAQDLDKGQAQAELVQLYVYNAVDQVQKKAKEAIISASSGD
jgi:alkylation response protein AidB-like acyl-CoA dehydrogenase